MDNLRLTRKKTIKNILNKSTKNCIFTKDKNNYLYYNTKENVSTDNIIKFNKLLGKSNTSRDGEVYEIVIKNIKTAIKIIPKKKVYNNNEIKIMELASKIVENNICPNFNLFYYSFLCNHNNKYNFKNINIKNIIKEINHIESYNSNLVKINSLLNKEENSFNDYKNFINIPKYKSKIVNLINGLQDEINTALVNYKDYNKSTIVILSELSDIDLNTYLSNNKNKDLSLEIKSILHQLLLSLRIMHYNSRILHLDLHTGNILLNKTREKGYWHYQDIDKYKEVYNDHFIKNEGYQVKISDFGRSYIIPEKSNNLNALSKIFKQLLRFFPIWLGEETYDSFKEALNKSNNLNNMEWCFYFDVWRMLSSFYNSIEKNNIIINKILEEFFVNTIQIMEQFILQVLSPLKKKKKKKNKIPLYEFTINFYILNIYQLEKEEIHNNINNKKINILNKNIYKFNLKNI